MVILTSSCCGCCSLAQGTIDTAILFVARSIFLLGGGGYLIKFGSSTEDSFLWSVGLGFVIAGGILLLPAILLFVGVKTKCKLYLLPWLILEGIDLFVSIATIFIRMTNGMSTIVEVALNSIIMSIVAYLYVVVLSYYESLQEQSSSHVDQELARPDSSSNLLDYMIIPTSTTSSTDIAQTSNKLNDPKSEDYVARENLKNLSLSPLKKLAREIAQETAQTAQDSD